MKAITTVAAVLAGLVLATPAAAMHGDTGTHEVGPYLHATSQFGADGGPHGLIHLEARPDEPSRIIGILISLTVPGSGTPRLAFADRPCGSTEAEFAVLPVPVEVRPDGTALLEHEGIFYGRALRRASALALLTGDPDRPIVLACAPLQTFAADPTPGQRDDIALSAARLDAGPSVIGGLLADADGPAAGTAVLRGLQPGKEYGLALSERPCAEATAAEAVPLGSAVADPAGSALAPLEMPAPTRLSLPFERSLLVILPGADAPVVAVCADARTAGVRRLR